MFPDSHRGGGTRGVGVTQRPSMDWLTSIVRRPGFWVLVGLFILISVPHYDETLHPPFVYRFFEYLDLDRHG